MNERRHLDVRPEPLKRIYHFSAAVRRHAEHLSEDSAEP